jgi:hypothetical protein
MTTWKDVLVPILRIIINDDGETPLYTDERLESLLLVAARYVEQEVVFNNDTAYTFDMVGKNIIPDPVQIGDDPFINFVTLKAACMSDIGQLRTKAMIAGLQARCGPAMLDTSNHLVGFKELITSGPCAAYETMKEQWIFSNCAVGYGILSPFVGNTFDTANLSLGDINDHRTSYY